jgi:hypothetical protein
MGHGPRGDGGTSRTVRLAAVVVLLAVGMVVISITTLRPAVTSPSTKFTADADTQQSLAIALPEGSGDLTERPTVQKGRSRPSSSEASAPEAVPDKYLIVGNTFGRHSNQMVVITAAMALARATRRVLVLPDLAYGGGNGGGGSVVTPVGTVYRLTPDTTVELGDGHVAWCVHGSACTVTATAFAAMAAQSFTSLEGNVGVECVGMRGVSLTPRPPRGSPSLKCIREPTPENTTLFVKHKKRLDEVMAVMRRLHAARVVYIPLVMYVASALEPVTSHSWRLFSPPLSIAAVVAAIVHNGSHPAPGKPYAAVHLRSLEGSCASRVKQYITDDMDFGRRPQRTDAVAVLDVDDSRAGPQLRTTSEVEAATELRRQCAMSPAYLEGYLRAAAGSATVDGKEGDSAGDAWCFLADDGQQPDTVTALKRALKHSKVVRVPQLCCDVSDRLAVVRAPSGILEVDSNLPTRYRTALGVDRAGNADAGSFYVKAPAREALGAAMMQVDFWTMAAADVFVGNQLSTLSVNVCRRRRAMGLPCQNFVFSSA